MSNITENFMILNEITWKVHKCSFMQTFDCNLESFTLWIPYKCLTSRNLNDSDWIYLKNPTNVPSINIQLKFTQFYPFTTLQITIISIIKNFYSFIIKLFRHLHVFQSLLTHVSKNTVFFLKIIFNILHA